METARRDEEEVVGEAEDDENDEDGERNETGEEDDGRTKALAVRPAARRVMAAEGSFMVLVDGYDFRKMKMKMKG